MAVHGGAERTRGSASRAGGASRALCAEEPNHAASQPFARVLEAYGTTQLLCCPDHANRFEARLAAASTGTGGFRDSVPLAASPATRA